MARREPQVPKPKDATEPMPMVVAPEPAPEPEASKPTLTKEQISRRMDLIALRERGWSDKQLADYFGVTKKELKAIEQPG